MSIILALIIGSLLGYFVGRIVGYESGYEHGQRLASTTHLFKNLHDVGDPVSRYSEDEIPTDPTEATLKNPWFREPKK